MRFLIGTQALPTAAQIKDPTYVAFSFYSFLLDRRLRNRTPQYLSIIVDRRDIEF